MKEVIKWRVQIAVLNARGPVERRARPPARLPHPETAAGAEHRAVRTAQPHARGSVKTTVMKHAVACAQAAVALTVKGHVPEIVGLRVPEDAEKTAVPHVLPAAEMVALHLVKELAARVVLALAEPLAVQTAAGAAAAEEAVPRTVLGVAAAATSAQRPVSRTAPDATVAAGAQHPVEGVEAPAHLLVKRTVGRPAKEPATEKQVLRSINFTKMEEENYEVNFKEQCRNRNQ